MNININGETIAWGIAVVAALAGIGTWAILSILFWRGYITTVKSEASDDSATAHAQVADEIAVLEAKTTAKEIASKYIGKMAVPWIVLLVAIGVSASYFLPEPALPAVIGLVSTAVMALIAMVTGITGIREKEDKPEFTIIQELIRRLDQKEPPVNVSVDGEKVQVTHGSDVVTTIRDKPGVEGTGNPGAKP